MDIKNNQGNRHPYIVVTVVNTSIPFDQRIHLSERAVECVVRAFGYHTVEYLYGSNKFENSSCHK